MRRQPGGIEEPVRQSSEHGMSYSQCDATRAMRCHAGNAMPRGQCDATRELDIAVLTTNAFNPRVTNQTSVSGFNRTVRLALADEPERHRRG
jgi:hypothetical protein